MPLALLSLVPPLPLPLLMLGSLLLTMSIVGGNTFWTAMEQQHVPEEVLGRIDSVVWTDSILIMPIAYAIAGPAAETIGVGRGAARRGRDRFACTGGALLSRSVRDLRRLDREPVPSPPDFDSGNELPAAVATTPHP